MTDNIIFPVKDGKASYAIRSDLAAPAAVLFTSEGQENKFGGKVSYSFHDIAEIFTEFSGKSLEYFTPPPGEFSKGYNIISIYS